MAPSWISAGIAIAAILFAVWFAEARAVGSFWPRVFLAAVGVGFIVSIKAWAVLRGRDVVRPVAFRFAFFELVVGLTFAAALMSTADESSLTATQMLSGALAALVFSLGLLSSQIGRNRLIGFRTPRTLGNDEAWHAANRAFGRALMVLSPLSLAGIVAGPAGPLVALSPLIVVAAVFLWRESRTRG